MLVNLLLLTSLATLLTGQLVRLPFTQSGAITLTDIFVASTITVFFIDALLVKKSLKIPQIVFTPFVLFTLSAISSTILAANFFAPSQIAVSSLFLFRFIIYFLLSVVVYNTISRKSIEKWINVLLALGVIFAFIGFFQLIFFSNLSSLQAYGWDPHQMRLVSTLLDPNFSGCIFAILAALSLSFYLFKNRKIYLLALGIFSVAIIFTFSRSSYLAIATVVATVGLVKAPRVLIISIAVFIFAFAGIRQVRSRIIGALTIDETASARIESWQNAASIFRQNALLGVGFNTYRYAQASFGFFSFDNPSGGHSGAGSDSSILLVAATTGIIGFGLYLYLLINMFRVFKYKARSNPLHLGMLSAFLGIIVDSQFVNSLFFPQVMLIFYFMLGIVLKNDD